MVYVSFGLGTGVPEGFLRALIEAETRGEACRHGVVWPLDASAGVIVAVRLPHDHALYLPRLI